MELIGVTSVSFSKNKQLVNELKLKFPKAKIILSTTKCSRHKLIYLVKKCNRIIVGLDVIDKEIIFYANKLHTISKFGVGLNNIDIEECNKKKITVNYTKGVNKRSVSELVISSAISLSRNLYNSNIQLKDGKWIVKGGENLSSKKFGIIGFGNIGRDLAKILGPLDCKIYYNDILKLKNISKKYISKSKKFIYSQCDFISIHLPLTKKTKNLINKNNLKTMKKNSILINTSRGGIINEKDLFIFLKRKKIKGAILDVYENEPFLNKNVLNLENLIALPHIGGSSKESILKMGRASIKNLET